MRALQTSKHFDKDLKKFGLCTELVEILSHLLNGTAVPEKYKDHPLKGQFKDFRDCHVKPDLVLIYKVEGDTVVLYRLNTHSELFS
ncbi:type II toxin-antitoxin system mRNA interferase toxin, RelE/StbE family [Pelistega indica]|uniref:type II toxin-antitoxin system YafQ family toxin n=1 Tax=Pelistega indica TaxID=1414851 RepID=UPI00041A2BA8|nr:type II toxin-antitoxin system mRNA interferase toxin, RelE/StbE family [Pelistega indica]